MKKLRIAMFMSSHPIQAGGVQEHVLYLSKELRRNGHTVTIFGPKPKKNKYTHYKVMGEKVYFPLPNGHQSNIHILGEFDKPEEVFTKKKFDILHIHEPYIPFAAWNVLENSTIPIVGTFHTVWDNESMLNILNSFIPLLKDKFSSYTHGAIFVSKITFEKWRSMCAQKMVKHIIPNAVDTSLFEPKNTINKTVKLLFVARLIHRKGLFPLLRAINILKERGLNFSLTIIGDGDEKKYNLNYIKEKKLKKYVHYLGEIRGEKRAQYFKESDIFCAPYVNEASSISVLEAVSSGLPIVGYKIPLFSDLLKDYPGKEFLVEKTDFALAHALEIAIQNPSSIQTLKKWCLEKRESFSWTTVAKQTEDLYYQVIHAYEKNHI
ncbi:MAG: glycosyltransferase family 4 protein [bacterium]